jgi:hypothetical protein
MKYKNMNMMKIFIKKMRFTINNMWILIFMVLCISSCKEFLDVVPDSTLKLENVFSTREEAYNALAKAYSYLPTDDQFHTSSWLLGDEWVTPMSYNDNMAACRAIHIMKGLQSEVKSPPEINITPILGLWSGTGGGKDLYDAIRSTNIFLEYMSRDDMVQDMEDAEKAEWKAQVKFLKAYYHFLLVQRYGPIVIADKTISPEAMKDELFQRRSKVDDCFNYIVRLMNEAIPDLKDRASMNDLGQVDKIAAKAIKARVLLFRASPFYSDNEEYFGDFFDHDGEPFFPIKDDATTKKAKWKDAVDAIEEAITFATSKENGKGLYTYDKAYYIDDSKDVNRNPAQMKKLMDLRMIVCDPWNKELLWGLSYYGAATGAANSLQAATNIMCPTGPLAWNTTGANNWLGASYAMLERYYTANGLPISEDKTFDRNTMYDTETTPGVDDSDYNKFAGIMQPGASTIKLYLNRELRFYAHLGITGGFWRSHTLRINTLFFSGNPSGSGGGYRSGNNYIATGIGVQKLVHPESTAGHGDRMAKYPLPIIRLADLYLMKAEALNEYLDAPNAEVYAAINEVRNRAGLENVQDVWSNTNIVVDSAYNKHTKKEGMRDIILQERSIEFAFEGSRYWDMLRHKRAPAEFSMPVLGWNHLGNNATAFFVLGVKQYRRFTITDCLCPIDLDEINTNSNLIQNPGW